MSLATSYPTIINGVTYAPFKTWDITYNDVKTVHTTEAGTQEEVILGTGRRSIAVSTTCLPTVASTLVNLEDLDNFLVKFYDIKTMGYIEHRMRVTANSMTCSLKEGSSKLSSADGVYTVSFTLEEYE